MPPPELENEISPFGSTLECLSSTRQPLDLLSFSCSLKCEPLSSALKFMEISRTEHGEINYCSGAGECRNSTGFHMARD